MTGITILDVFIGLIFLYLLYSLFATIILELINNFLKLRALNVTYVLKRMLFDEKKPSSLKNMFNPILGFAGLITNVDNKELYKKFVRQPAIKYLGNGGLFNKPSYLGSEVFSKNLLDTLKENSNNAETSLEQIKSGLNNFFPNESDSKKYILSLLSDANNDLEKFKILLEDWYNNTMERAIGWYKRKTQIILLTIGFIMAFGFNLNTIEIAKTLSVDEEVRNQLVKMSKEFVETKNKVDENNQTIVVTDSTNSEIIVKIDSLLQAKSELEDDMNLANKYVGAGWPDQKTFIVEREKDTSLKHRKLFYKNRVEIADCYLYYKNTIVGVKYPKNVNKASFEKFITENYEPNKGEYKLCSFKWWSWRNNIVGYLLTALAISLGAPFWFDLLNKLIKLRGSVAQGTTTTETTKNKTKDKNDILNRVG